MNDFWQDILSAWQAQSNLELVAVICAILYLVLVVRENIWCWLFAFISTAIYIYLFHTVSLLSESILNVFYLFMALYGWYVWRFGNRQDQRDLRISRWPLKKHLLWIGITGLCVPVLGYQMNKWGASFPYLDAFTSCFAVLATVMVAHKILENWHYWFIIDGLSIYLFWQKELYLTACLFVLYLVLILFGYNKWMKTYADQQK